MRQFFRITLRVLVLAAVFLVSALTAMRFAIHGREVAVPALAGATLPEAERSASANGLLLGVEDRFYSADVSEGRVLSQMPPAGEKVRRGTHLRVTLSLGPQKMTIPSVIGQSQRAAELNIGRRGLELGSVAVATLPGLPSDQVVAQSPPPEATEVASPKVNLLVSSAAEPAIQLYITPDFVGRSINEAAVAIAKSPMRFGQVTTVKPANGAADSGEQAVGTVAGATPKQGALIVKQSPAAGQQVPPGTQINFEVVR